MEIDFDPAKDAKNVAARGLSLAFGAIVLLDPHRLSDIDARRDYGEQRINVLGKAGDRVYFVTYTQRGDAIRIISVRKANLREQRRYHQAQSES